MQIITFRMDSYKVSGIEQSSVDLEYSPKKVESYVLFSGSTDTEA